MPGTTPGYDHGLDGSTGFYGIKWDVTDEFTEGTFTVVLDGHYAGAEDCNGVLAKGGNKFEKGPMVVPTDEVSAGGCPFGGAFGDDERPALLGPADDGGIDSAESFGEWYRDVLGVNLSAPLSITMERQDDGTYLFDDMLDSHFRELGGFYPLEGQLFGHHDNSHHRRYCDRTCDVRNTSFTYELHASFTYDSTTDDFLRIASSGDVWVFIDGRLVIDLGGAGDGREQYLDVERLGLVDGETYSLDLFLAQRHDDGSSLRIETSLELEGASGVLTVTNFAD
jgi:fibro-slime domain-containing protein